MKLLLIRERSEICGDISQGIGIIGTIAKKVASVRIIDNNSHLKKHTHPELLRIISEYKPDIIGFHVHTHNIFVTKKLVYKIKQNHPNTCLIGGGLQTYSEPYEVAELGMHIVTKGEADLTIIPILNALKSFVGSDSKFIVTNDLSNLLKDVPGILFANSDESNWEDTGKPQYIEDLDELPFVDHDLFNLHDYIKGKEAHHHYVTNTLITQRGCPFNCPFCQGRQDGDYKKFRENSPQYKLDYVKYLVDKYDHNLVAFYDANFTLNRKNTIEFCTKMIESGLNKKLTFWCETNVVLPVDKTLAQLLKKAGCTEIALGIERLTVEGLKRIRKNKKYEVIIKNVQNLVDAGINVTANALVGFPFDTVDTIQEELRLYSKLAEKVKSVMVSILLPLPGTEVYRDTNSPKWYLDEKHMSWKPPFYHFAYNYNGDAWYANYFNLNDKTMMAIRKMRESMYSQGIKKIGNRTVDILFYFVRILASISFTLFRISPIVERIVFLPVNTVYLKLWKTMVSRYYVVRLEGE